MKLLFVFVLCLIVLASGENTDDQRKSATDKAVMIASGLYVTLRNVAFPQHTLSDTTEIDSRFILLTPGLVLNYFDYFPGRDYVNFIQNPSAGSNEAIVPPHVMEKWFDLADAMPDPNPLNGQNTGKSLGNIYSSILHEIKVLGFHENRDEGSYNQAVAYLNELLNDPENITIQLPRLALYERYRDLYNDRKLSMENQVENKRKNLGYLDYEQWFQRNYPSLQAKVESAYTRWLIFGDKEKVEQQITILDTGSSGQVLEEARMALRAAGVTSLDRTRTIYPVSFVPSDWYKYLLPDMQRPSRDQLQLMLGKLQGKSDAINAMITAVQNNKDISATVADLQNKYKSLQSAVAGNVTNYMNKQFECVQDPSGISSNCIEYNAMREETIDLIASEASAFSSYKYADYYNTDQSDYVAQLQKERDSYDAQIRKINAYLSDSAPYLRGILDASPLAVSNLTDSYRDDQWLQFEYNSNSSYENTNEMKTAESISAHASFGSWFFRASGDYSHTKNTDDYNQQLANSQMRVKGEIMRVEIKRPWFKPEVFENPDITYEESDDKGNVVYVSPGQQLTESEFFAALTNANRQYKLPEYATAFLLARNLELEFSGLDSSTVTSFMSETSHYSGGGGFFCFSASVSVTKSKQVSHVEVMRTASGMKIKIPGAQLIGYYTKILPRFPQEQ